MKAVVTKPIQYTTMICTLLISCVSLFSCTGGSVLSAGIGGTGIVFGSITGFGSVHVNGGRFETNQSQFIVDGNANATEGDLSLGMVVKLEVEVENGVIVGNAIKVIYDDEIQGPVATTPVVVTGSGGSQKTFEIFGQTITIDDVGTVFEATSFTTIDVLDVVEISGFRTSVTEISATYVSKKGELVPGVSAVELRGVISAFSAVNQEFVIDGTVIRYDNATHIEVPAGLFGNGTYVEVEGVYQIGASVLADDIEYEEQGFGGDVNDVSLQGIISLYTSIADFYIDGQQVDASQATLSPANAASLLENGLDVEVEGDIVNGVLFADELEVREGESKLRTFVSAIDLVNNRFEVNYAPLTGSVVINTDVQTLFEDNGPLELPNFSLDLMNIGDFVRVEGIEINGEITASIVKREDPDDSKLTGAVDSFVFDTSITILDITYGVDAATHYEGFANSSAFFSQLVIGDLLEIKDNQVADGIADEVEEE